MTDTTAKPQPGRHRAKPRRLPTALILSAAILGVYSLFFLDGWEGTLASTTTLIISVAYFVQHLRHAMWTVTAGALKELEKR